MGGCQGGMRARPHICFELPRTLGDAQSGCPRSWGIPGALGGAPASQLRASEKAWGLPKWLSKVLPQASPRGDLDTLDNGVKKQYVVSTPSITRLQLSIKGLSQYGCGWRWG